MFAIWLTRAASFSSLDDVKNFKQTKMIYSPLTNMKYASLNQWLPFFYVAEMFPALEKLVFSTWIIIIVTG